MKKLLLAGVLMLACVPAYAQDTLPDAMLGSWTMADEEGIMERAGPDSGDFNVEKNAYYGVDTECTILHVEKRSKNVYTVQARCKYPEDIDPPPFPPYTETDEFELKGDKLRVSPVNS